jgi:hypothetical protein
LKRELASKDTLVDNMRAQLKQAQGRERNKIEASLAHQDTRLQQEKENLEVRIRQQEAGLQSLADCLNALEPATRSEDPLKRAIRYLSVVAVNGARNSLNSEGRRRDSTSSKESKNSRYEELVRKKSLVAEQFKHSEQFLNEQPAGRE